MVVETLLEKSDGECVEALKANLALINAENIDIGLSLKNRAEAVITGGSENTLDQAAAIVPQIYSEIPYIAPIVFTRWELCLL